jgi:hypothetical protein
MQQRPMLVIGFAISSGLLGGVLTKKWDDLSEEKVINARAKSATLEW